MTFGFGRFLILIRILDKDNFGTWVLFLAITSVMEMGRNGLVQNALVKHLTNASREDYPKIFTASLFINAAFVFTCIGFIGIFAGSLRDFWSANHLDTMLYIYMLRALSMIFSSQADFVQLANFKFQGTSMNHFTRQGSFFVVVLLSYIFDWTLTLPYLAWYQFLCTVLGTVVALLFASRYMRFSPLDFQWVKKLFNYGKYVMGTGLSSIIFKSTDQMMLGNMVSLPAVASYNAALRVANFVEVPTLTVSAIVFPQNVRRSETEGHGSVKRLYEKSVGAVLCLTLPAIAAILLFSDEIVYIIAGDKYAEAASLLELTILYSLFIPYLRQFGTTLDAIGFPKINFYFVIGNSLVNVFLNYIFISYYDIFGAVYGTLSTFTLGFVVSQYLLYRILKVNALNSLKYCFEFYIQIFNKLRSKVISGT